MYVRGTPHAALTPRARAPRRRWAWEGWRPRARSRRLDRVQRRARSVVVSAALAIAVMLVVACACACGSKRVLAPVLSSGPARSDGLGVPPPVAVRPVPTRGVAQIALGDRVGCARWVDGTVRCWGAGMLGDGSNDPHVTPVQVHGITTAVSIFAGAGYTCAMLRDGSVPCWGGLMWFDTNTGGTTLEPRAMERLAGATAVYSSPTSEGCARFADRTLSCWGTDAGARAAAETGSTEWSPIQPGLASATSLAISARFGCALMPDATVQCWGDNRHGQLGVGPVGGERAAPARVGSLAHVAQVVVGADSACARHQDGTVSCWGSDENGQLGDGGTTDRGRPQRVPGVTEVIDLVAGGDHVLALRRDLTVECWGYNASRQCGVESAESTIPPHPIPGLQDVIALAATQWNSCALIADGSVQCWGAGRGGANGDGTQADRAVPTAIHWEPARLVDRGLPADVRVSSFALGVGVTCAALSDGSVRCWGDDSYGEVSGVRDEGRADPVIAVPRPLAGVPHVTSVACGIEMTARLADGRTASWGSGDPIHIDGGPPVDAVVAGTKYTCKLRRGVATCQDPLLPAAAVKSGVLAMTAEGGHACVLLASHGVACAGENSHGELGDGTTTATDGFVTVPGLTDVVQVAATDTGTCVRRTDGSVACWGDRDVLGTSSEHDALVPVTIAGLTETVDLFGGSEAACARSRNGTVSCWGDWNQPYSPDRERAVPVPWLTGATQIRNGAIHSCALFRDGRLGCWGNNAQGELGDQTFTDSTQPTRVRW